MSETGIQQLWYTWSEFGYGDLRGGGLRVRAASEQILCTDGRMEKLEKYAGYKLPRDARRDDPALEQTAPRSLAFLRIPSKQTSQDEFILVHTVYTRDERGRPGAFFTHILTDLPQTFSAKEAIELWRAGLWQTTNPSQHEYSLQIPSIPPDDLKHYYRRPTCSLETTEPERFNRYLKFLIHAYFLQQDELERKQEALNALYNELLDLQQEKRYSSGAARNRLDKLYNEKKALYEQEAETPPAAPVIYFAAQPDELASLIGHLTELLEPLSPRLYNTLTFSTYEYNIFRGDCHIVGTCLSSPSASTTLQNDILPLECYTLGFAFNSYTGRHTSLEAATYTSGELAYLPMFVDFLTQPHLHSKIFEKLQQEAAKEGNALTVRKLLQSFHKYAVRLKNMTPEQITQLFTNRDLDMLADFLVRDAILTNALNQQTRSSWFQQELIPAVSSFVRTSRPGSRESRIVDSFAQEAIKLLKQFARERNHGAFDTIYTFFKCLAPSYRSPAWKSLLETLVNDQESCNFIGETWELRIEFLAIAAYIEDEDKPEQTMLPIIAPLLAIATEHYADLLDSVNSQLATPGNTQPQLPLSWRTTALQYQLALLHLQRPLTLDTKLHIRLLAEARDCLGKEHMDHVEEVAPLLGKPVVTEHTFASLLPLHLPTSWNALAIYHFNQQSNPTLAPATIQALSAYHDELIALITQQRRADKPDYHQGIEAFYDKVVKSNYPQCCALLRAWHDLLLKSPAQPQVGPELRRLIEHTPLLSQEMSSLLKIYKEAYKKHDQDILVDLIEHFIRQEGFGTATMTLVLSIFAGAAVSEKTMTTLLQRARINEDTQAIEQFFQTSTYISSYPLSNMLLSMFEKLINAGSHSTIQILKLWLEAWQNVEPVPQAAWLINKACAEDSEREEIIRAYGSVYLSKQPEHTLAKVFIRQFHSTTATGLLNKWPLLTDLFAACSSDALREQLLAPLTLTPREKGLLIDKYGAMPFFYSTEAGAKLYQASITAGEVSSKRKMEILSAWLHPLPKPELFDKMCALSNLNNNEQQQIVARVGVECLTSYAIISDTLQKYILNYLEELDASTLIPADKEQHSLYNKQRSLLETIKNASSKLSLDITTLAAGWQRLNIFFAQTIRQTEWEPRDDKMEELRGALSNLLGFAAFKITQQGRLRLWQVLASILTGYIKKDISLWLFLLQIKDYSSPDDRNDLLYEMGTQAGKLYQAHTDITLLLPYIRALPCLTIYFSDLTDETQEATINNVWNALLQVQGSEQRTRRVIKEISEYIKSASKAVDWDERVSRAWLKYEDAYNATHRAISPAPEPVATVPSAPLPMPVSSQQGTPPAGPPLVKVSGPIATVPSAPLEPALTPAAGGALVLGAEAAGVSANTRQTRVLPWQYILPLLILRVRIARRKGAERMAHWWKEHSALGDYPELIGETTWEKLKLARDFATAYQLMSTNSSPDPDLMAGLVEIANEIQDKFPSKLLSESEQKYVQNCKNGLPNFSTIPQNRS
jgi:hypothetical protein